MLLTINDRTFMTRLTLTQLAWTPLGHGHCHHQFHLRDANLHVAAGEFVGLIGPNGSGKTSLLRCAYRFSKPESGEVHLEHHNLWQQPPRWCAQRIAVVLQEFPDAFGLTVEEVVAMGRTPHKGLFDVDTDADRQLASNALRDVGLHGFEEHAFATLSGGEKQRVILARALTQQPDVLILDEPTNHLDLDAIRWLEDLLLDFKGAVVAISHDRAFLDRVATRIVELDRGKLLSYPGNFSRYQQLKQEQLAQEATINARADKLLAQEEVWVRKGVEARRTRAQGRINRLQALRAARLARRDAVGRVRLDVDAGVAGYQGKLVAELDNVSLAFGDKRVVEQLSTTVLRGDKIGLIGPNGAGKTTLLKLILGDIEPDSGRIQRGANQQVAYFDQMRAALDPDATLEDFISPGSEWIEIGAKRQHVKSYLGDFLFSPARAASPVRSLSGGERNRLLLARLFARPANVLVLDEPTNDLDIDTLELLEELLQGYEGTVFLVSHDRTFLDNVVTSTLAWDGPGAWREYEGGVQDWLAQSARWQAMREAEARAASDVSDQTSLQRTPDKREQLQKKKLSYKDQRELDALPALIDALEQEQADIRARLADGTLYQTDLDQAVALQARDGVIEEELMAALERWETLSSHS